MSAHMPGCVWDAARRCYTVKAAGCAAPEEHAEWKQPTFCALCGDAIVFVSEEHRCRPASCPRCGGDGKSFRGGVCHGCDGHGSPVGMKGER